MIRSALKNLKLRFWGAELMSWDTELGVLWSQTWAHSHDPRSRIERGREKHCMGVGETIFQLL